jgi:Tfp pilus assembly pilus retraction ATPase PilT
MSNSNASEAVSLVAPIETGSYDDVTVFTKLKQEGLQVEATDPKRAKGSPALPPSEKGLHDLQEQLLVDGSIEAPVAVTKTKAAISPTLKGRGLACSCFGGKLMSITVRGNTGPDYGIYNPLFEELNDIKNIDHPNKILYRCKYKPSNDLNGNMFSIYDVCFILYDLWSKHYEGKADGLVVVAGGTGSGKTQVVQGMIFNLLNENLRKLKMQRYETITDIQKNICKKASELKMSIENTEEKVKISDEYLAINFTRIISDINFTRIDKLKKKIDSFAETEKKNFKNILKIIDSIRKEREGLDKVRRPHLLTIENPIEKYLFENADKERCEPEKIQKEFGIDYTARQIPQDTPNLKKALLGDALRQTPAITYVGEIRNEEEIRAVTEFAGTGHLVVTTMHAGSTREALLRILKANNAELPAEQGIIAKRIRAIIHVQPFEIAGTKTLIPAMWFGNDAGVSALIADGPSSVIPHFPSKNEANRCYSLGHQFFADELIKKVKEDNKTEKPERFKQVDSSEEEMLRKAIEKDLNGD